VIFWSIIAKNPIKYRHKKERREIRKFRKKIRPKFFEILEKSRKYFQISKFKKYKIFRNAIFWFKIELCLTSGIIIFKRFSQGK
jgi:hypothetical protein